MSETGNGMEKVVFQSICSIKLNSCDQNRQIGEKQLIDFIKEVTHWKRGMVGKMDFLKKA